MKKWICIISAVALLVSLTACGQKNGDVSQPEEGGLTLLATTYPVYLLASAVADGVEGVTVEQLNTGEVSCLHDYTLSVGDMKLIEGADILAINGVGLEDFMGDALATAQGTVIDCSQGIELAACPSPALLPSTMDSSILPKPLTCLSWLPSRRRRAARPAPR